MPKLTKRQAQILTVISDYIEEKGYGPTVREIGNIVHLASPSTVHGHMEKLKEKGFITWEPTHPRTLRILKTAS